jgi:hypothetical protein
MVEQGTHKPLDVGSNPTLATNVFVWGDFSGIISQKMISENKGDDLSFTCRNRLPPG